MRRRSSRSIPSRSSRKRDAEPRSGREHAKRVTVERRNGPILIPQKVFDWKLVYDPAANGGAGAIEAALGGDSVSLPLKPGDKQIGATFDRFGLFTSHIGGSYVRIFFDDLAYTRQQSP